MAVKQNGVLACFTPTVTPYVNLTTASGTSVTPNGFNFYTCPGATMMSGKLVINNATGGAATVDVAIVDQTEAIQLTAAGSQSPAGTAFSDYVFTTNSYTTSVQADIANLGGTSTFAGGETLSWTNSGLPSAYQSCTATIVYWDASNTRLWLRNMSHPLGFELSGDTNFTSSGGGTCSAGPTYAGTGGTAGNSGRVRHYDSRRGVIYFQNYEFKNNLNYSVLYDVASEVRELNNNTPGRCFGNEHRPVATTVTRYAAAGNTTPTTEFVDSTGKNLLIASVSETVAEQFILKDQSIADNSTYELNGLVLGTYQSLYITSSAAVSATLMGFEETAEVAS